MEDLLENIFLNFASVNNLLSNKNLKDSSAGFKNRYMVIFLGVA